MADEVHEAFQRERFSVNGLLPQLLDAQARKEHHVLDLHTDSVKIPAISELTTGNGATPRKLIMCMKGVKEHLGVRTH